MYIELEIIAFIASSIGVTASVPQIIQIIKTGETKAISYHKYIMCGLSSILWICFGLMVPTYSIAIWNSISIILVTTVLVLKFKNESPFYLKKINRFFVKQ